MKTTFSRIHYYTKKIVEYGSYTTFHLSKPRWYENRHNRLTIYKNELIRRMELEGNDAWWS